MASPLLSALRTRTGDAPAGSREEGAERPSARAAAAARARHLVRGRPDDPIWVHPALLALLAGTAVL